MSFDSCRFLLLGGPFNVIGVLKIEVYNKGQSSSKIARVPADNVQLKLLKGNKNLSVIKDFYD